MHQEVLNNIQQIDQYKESGGEERRREAKDHLDLQCCSKVFKQLFRRNMKENTSHLMLVSWTESHIKRKPRCLLLLPRDEPLNDLIRSDPGSTDWFRSLPLAHTSRVLIWMTCRICIHSSSSAALSILLPSEYYYYYYGVPGTRCRWLAGWRWLLVVIKRC